ncbi:hypothetical protein GEMRC1_011809 [Eukaryota sp. GEM-RC1]
MNRVLNSVWFVTKISNLSSSVTEQMIWFTHFCVLLWKNYLTLKRSPSNVILRTVLPVAVIIILIQLSKMTAITQDADFRQQGRDIKHPESNSISKHFPTCDLPCYTLAVSPDEPSYRKIISIMMDQRGQSIENVVFLPSSKELSLYLYNGTKVPVLAAIDFKEDDNYDNTIKAVVRLNASATSTCTNEQLYGAGYSYDPCFPLVESTAFPIHASLQQALMTYTAGEDFTIDFSWAFAPHPVVSRGQVQTDASSYVSYLFLSLVLLLSFLVIDEKKSSMRAHLIQCGMKRLRILVFLASNSLFPCPHWLRSPAPRHLHH